MCPESESREKVFWNSPKRSANVGGEIKNYKLFQSAVKSLFLVSPGSSCSSSTIQLMLTSVSDLFFMARKTSFLFENEASDE